MEGVVKSIEQSIAQIVSPFLARVKGFLRHSTIALKLGVFLNIDLQHRHKDAVGASPLQGCEICPIDARSLLSRSTLIIKHEFSGCRRIPSTLCNCGSVKLVN
jgi:hypothetical protein